MLEFNNLDLFVGTTIYTVGTAPVGLLILENGSIICKSEYRTKGSCDCTIISSGENYFGEGDNAKCKALHIR